MRVWISFCGRLRACQGASRPTAQIMRHIVSTGQASVFDRGTVGSDNDEKIGKLLVG
jgi:hypothetical protein